MVLHERLRQLRLEKKWSQAELAEKVGVHQKQISAYERGTNNPSTDVLIKLAETFDVSIDYIAFEKSGGSKSSIKDRELLEYFEAIDNFPDDQKQTAKEILNLIVIKNKIYEIASLKK